MRWPAVDAGMADRVEGGPIRIWLAIAPPERPTAEDLQKVVAEIWERVAPCDSAVVRTVEQEFGLEAAGHPQRAIASLQEAGLEVAVFDAVEENPTSRHVAAGLKVAQRETIDFLVALKTRGRRHG